MRSPKDKRDSSCTQASYTLINADKKMNHSETAQTSGKEKPYGTATQIRIAP